MSKFPKREYIYDAKIIKVTDGDTLKMEIDFGFETFVKTKMRILDLDTHECRRIKRDGIYVSAEEVTSGKECRDLVRKLLLNKKVRIRTFKASSKGKFGRYLAAVEFMHEGLPTSYSEYIKELGYDRNLNPL